MSYRRDAAERRAREEATPSTSRYDLDSDSGSVRSSRSTMSHRPPPGDPQAALFHAARHGRVNELRSLVMSGADLHKPDAKGQSVLHSVAKHGHIQVSARIVPYRQHHAHLSRRLHSYNPPYGSSTGRLTSPFATLSTRRRPTRCNFRVADAFGRG